MKVNYLSRNEGEVKTPWDRYYLTSLIRVQPIPPKAAPSILEFGVNYFILKLESMGIKTFWSCEGHPCGFYIVFKAPYKIARKISFVSSEFASVSISHITKKFFKPDSKELDKIESRRNNCWRLELYPYGTSYEHRNFLLRNMSLAWEKYL